MSDDLAKAVLEEVANAMQSALLLASRVRRAASEQAAEAAALEAAVDRAVRALSKLKPDAPKPSGPQQ